MSDYAEKVRQIQRERVTEEKVRAKDASEIVDWVHALEDKVEALREGIANARLCDTIVQMDECLATLQEQGDE
jgi:hypothetical protein